jgi:hypothetical protein
LGKAGAKPAFARSVADIGLCRGEPGAVQGRPASAAIRRLVAGLGKCLGGLGWAERGLMGEPRKQRIATGHRSGSQCGSRFGE